MAVSMPMTSGLEQMSFLLDCISGGMLGYARPSRRRRSLAIREGAYADGTSELAISVECCERLPDGRSAAVGVCTGRGTATTAVTTAICRGQQASGGPGRVCGPLTAGSDCGSRCWGERGCPGTH